MPFPDISEAFLKVKQLEDRIYAVEEYISKCQELLRCTHRRKTAALANLKAYDLDDVFYQGKLAFFEHLLFDNNQHYAEALKDLETLKALAPLSPTVAQPLKELP